MCNNNLVAVGNEEVWKKKLLTFVGEVLDNNPSRTIIIISGSTKVDVPKHILEKYPQSKVSAISEQNGVFNSFPKRLNSNKVIPVPPRPIKNAEEMKKYLKDNNVLIIAGMQY